jgi:N-acetylglucosamine-6-sulfatase
VIKEVASELIRGAPSKKPLFGWIAPNAPHAPGTPAPRHKSAPCEVDPWQPPSWNEADVSDKPAYVRQLPLIETPTRLDRYCRPLLAVDELVGEIKSALQATGRLNDTLFIYTGDNGMEMGEHRLPLKSAPYQTQVPFYARWPNALGTGPATVTQRVQSIDVAPTLAELANAALGPFPNGQAAPDGLSFVPLLFRTASTLGRGTVLEEMLTDWRGVPEWNSVTTTAESPLASQGCAAASAGGCRWHYTEYPVSGEEELYDISNGPCWEWAVGQPGDPCELGNRAASPGLANIKAALRAELARLKAERGQ